MNAQDFNEAILRAEAILLEKGFLEPTEELLGEERFKDFNLNYQPVKYMAGFMAKKMERCDWRGQKFTFEIYVKGTGDPTFLEIYQRIFNNLI